MIDGLLKFWPVLIFPVGLTALYLSAAKATQQELEKVKTWWASTIMVLVCAGAIGWYGIQCASFVLSDAPITRQAVGLFALNLIDIGLAWVALVLYFTYRSKRTNANTLRELQARKEELQDQILDARERTILAKSNTYTDERIHDVISQMKERPTSIAD